MRVQLTDSRFTQLENLGNFSEAEILEIIHVKDALLDLRQRLESFIQEVNDFLSLQFLGNRLRSDILEVVGHLETVPFIIAGFVNGKETDRPQLLEEVIELLFCKPQLSADLGFPGNPALPLLNSLKRLVVGLGLAPDRPAVDIHFPQFIEDGSPDTLAHVGSKTLPVDILATLKGPHEPPDGHAMKVVGLDMARNPAFEAGDLAADNGQKPQCQFLKALLGKVLRIPAPGIEGLQMPDGH